MPEVSRDLQPTPHRPEYQAECLCGCTCCKQDKQSQAVNCCLLHVTVGLLLLYKIYVYCIIRSHSSTDTEVLRSDSLYQSHPFWRAVLNA